MLGHGGKGTYGLIKERLTLYHRERKSGVRHALLGQMTTLIADWRRKHGSSASHENRERAKNLNVLELAIALELPEATLHSEYVSDLSLGKFKYASYESQGEIRATDKLMSGETGSAELGLGKEALEEIEKYGLTEAQVLAIKVYSVGDYQTINPTLAGVDDWLKATLPKVGGLLKDPSGMPILEPQGEEPVDPQGKATWQAQKQKFDLAAQAFLAQTPLATVKAEAQRHATLVLSGLKLLPAYRKVAYRGERLGWKEYQAKYASQGAVVRSAAFLSTSKKRERAEQFARKQKDDGKVGVLLVCKLKDGRDIERLSAHGNEAEVLLFPGAGLRVDQPRLSGRSEYDYEVDVTEV